jgi:hypothetical protein
MSGSPQASGPQAFAARAGQWLTAVASLAVGALFFALWFWLLPRWLGPHIPA